MRTGVTGRILKAIKAGGWWTSAEIATKTGDKTDDVQDGIDELRGAGVIDRRHLGSDHHGDLFAYRLVEAA